MAMGEAISSSSEYIVMVFTAMRRTYQPYPVQEELLEPLDNFAKGQLIVVDVQITASQSNRA
jgi:hypothetical protein